MKKNILLSGLVALLAIFSGCEMNEDQKFDIGFDPADIYRRANEIIRRMK